MFPRFLRLLTKQPAPPARVSQVAEGGSPHHPNFHHPNHRPVDHRSRLLGMRLSHLQLCGSERCRRLESYGVATAGDLLTADVHELAVNFNAARKALRTLKTYRRAIQLAAAIPGMMPRDALLLVQIHRRSTRTLAAESATALRRDLQRFAESSRGQSHLRGRRLPSLRRIKRWIVTCGELSQDARPTSFG